MGQLSALEFHEALGRLGASLDTELSADDLRALVKTYKSLVEAQWGKPFPQEVHEQLWGAVGAVFGSWQSERAKVYRRLNDIPGSWGTAVNVQAMVFGNMTRRPPASPSPAIRRRASALIMASS